MKPINIPQLSTSYWWDGTTSVQCHCGGSIEWAENGYTPGARACLKCKTLFMVRGDGGLRQLVPQSNVSGVVQDADENDALYKVPDDFFSP